MASNDILLSDGIVLSQRHFINIKLRSSKTDFGNSIYIELQEVKKNEDQTEYSAPIYIPASDKALLLAELIRNYAMKGRKIKREIKEEGKAGTTEREEAVEDEKAPIAPSTEENSEGTVLSNEELADFLYLNFKGKQVIKSNITTFVNEHGISGNTNSALTFLLEKKLVTCEERTSKSGNRYQLWRFA